MLADMPRQNATIVSSARERSFQPSSSMIEPGEAYCKPSLWLQPAP